MARMTQLTMKSLFALEVGRHNLALRQRKKNQFPFEKSGFRPFRKWSFGETNVIQTGTLLSQISLSPSPRSVWSLSLSTVANYRIGHCEQEYCQSTTIRGLKKRGYCETKCAQGVRTLTTNPFEKKQNSKIEKALTGSDNSKPSEIGKKHGRDPESDSDEPNPKRQDLGGESNMDAHKSADPLPKNSGKQQLLEWEDGDRESSGDLAVNVELEMKGEGEYVLKIKRVSPSSTDEDEVERAKQMAQKAAMLLLYGEMLLDMGKKLRAQSRASLNSIFERPAPSNYKSD